MKIKQNNIFNKNSMSRFNKSRKNIFICRQLYKKKMYVLRVYYHKHQTLCILLRHYIYFKFNDLIIINNFVSEV